MNSRFRDEDKVLESLQKAVSDALERKRRLGQYAVVWRDGRPARIGPGFPSHAADGDMTQGHHSS